MASDVALTQGQRSTLVSLRETRDLITRTQGRLASGKRINDVTDGAASFFASRSLSNRAELFLERKDETDQGIETLRAALNGLDALIEVVESLRGIISEARAQLSTVSRATSTDSFNELGRQFVNLVQDTNYNGLNLINNATSVLQITFSDDSDSRIRVGAENVLHSTDGVFGSVGANFVGNARSGGFFSVLGRAVIASTGFANGFSVALGGDLSALSRADVLTEHLRDAELRLQDRQSELGTRVAILQQRSDFSQDYATTLAGGSDLLTLADLNEETANFTALRTNNQFGTQSLALESQISSSLLSVLA